MGSTSFARLMAGPVLFFGLAAAMVLAKLLPLATAPDGWPGPNLLFCLTVAWVLRRPDLLPVWTIAVVGLLADLLLQQPPGLGAALLVVCSEFVRWRGLPGQVLSPTGEIALFAALLTSAILAAWLVQAIFLVPQPALYSLLAQIPLTLVAYPIVAVFLVHVCGIRRLSDAAWRAMGRV